MHAILSPLFGSHQNPTSNRWICVLNRGLVDSQDSRSWTVWLALDEAITSEQIHAMIDLGNYVNPLRFVPFSYFGSPEGYIPMTIATECIRQQPYIQFGIDIDWCAIGGGLAGKITSASTLFTPRQIVHKCSATPTYHSVGSALRIIHASAVHDDFDDSDLDIEI